MLRIAIVGDFREENWPSMDLVADMLFRQLEITNPDAVQVTRICPAFKKRIGFWSSGFGLGEQSSRNADRLLNRFWDYPRFVRRIKKDFDLFHVVDHSYSQLVHELPPNRTIVTCHDLDTFKCLLEPEQEPRSILFRAMTKRTLNGFRKAAFVTCDSEATRDQILEHKLISADRLVVVTNGVHPSCSAHANAAADALVQQILTTEDTEESKQREPGSGQKAEGNAKADCQSVGPQPNPLPMGEGTVEQGKGNIDLLHVGSTIPRKRIDLLLRVFAELKKAFPSARLLRVGGPFTNEQEQLARDLNIRDSIVVLPHLKRDVLAAVYRRATLVLLTSEREGFGLPVIEAMACGTPVVASDLPVLREIGGDAVEYCALTDFDSWTRTITELTNEQNKDAERWTLRKERALAQAQRFSWAEYARAMVEIYQSVLSAPELLPSKQAVSVQHAPNLFGPTV